MESYTCRQADNYGGDEISEQPLHRRECADGVGARGAGEVHLGGANRASVGLMQGEDLTGELLGVSLGMQLLDIVFLLGQGKACMNLLNMPQHGIHCLLHGQAHLLIPDATCVQRPMGAQCWSMVKNSPGHASN